MTSPSAAASERAVLADALAAAGPDAPTLCEGWTTRDLAAHLVARERRPDSALGLVLRPLSGWSERVRRGIAGRPYVDLVRDVREGPPRTSPFALPGVDAAANLAEHFVHAEDVLRAPAGATPREVPAPLQDALWSVLTARGRLLLRASPVGVRLATPDGRQHTVVPREPVVTLRGEPAELVLFAYGRTAQARVALEGPPEAVAALRATKLGI